jgi:hypothetical protein
MARLGRRRATAAATYLEVMGKLVAEGVFVPDPPVAPARERVKVDDVIEVGRREPRVLELLPALLAKRPGMFVSRRDLPAELAAAVERLKAGRTPQACFGISGTKLLRALRTVTKARDKGSRLKAFRLTDADREVLLELSDELALSETDVIRHALRMLRARLAK